MYMLVFSTVNKNTDAQSGSLLHNRLGCQAPQITLEYYLVTKITTRPLTQPVTCEMGLYVFAAMSRLKVASTISASLTIISSTKRTKGEKCFRK